MTNYKVTLTEDERNNLLETVTKGSGSAAMIRKANILLAADRGLSASLKMTDEQAAETYHAATKTVYNIKRSFVEDGLETALARKKREKPGHIKIDGNIEAKIVALTCTDPPEGHARWTLRLLADRVVELGHVGSISHVTIGDVLKNKLKPWIHEEWCIPTCSCEFVAHRQDVLHVYEQPYDPLRPLVCVDELSKQLIGHSRGNRCRLSLGRQRDGIMNRCIMEWQMYL